MEPSVISFRWYSCINPSLCFYGLLVLKRQLDSTIIFSKVSVFTVPFWEFFFLSCWLGILVGPKHPEGWRKAILVKSSWVTFSWKMGWRWPQCNELHIYCLCDVPSWHTSLTEKMFSTKYIDMGNTSSYYYQSGSSAFNYTIGIVIFNMPSRHLVFIYGMSLTEKAHSGIHA